MYTNLISPPLNPFLLKMERHCPKVKVDKLLVFFSEARITQQIKFHTCFLDYVNIYKCTLSKSSYDIQDAPIELLILI